MSIPRVGQTLIVTEKMPCQRESSRRHATIPEGQQIIILEPVEGSNWVRFAAGCEGATDKVRRFPFDHRAVLRSDEADGAECGVAVMSSSGNRISREYGMVAYSTESRSLGI